MNLDSLIKQGILAREPLDQNLINKEVTEGESDLREAERSFFQSNYKWAIIQSYYAMFHAAKAVLFSMGVREKKHVAVAMVLEMLSKEGKIEARFVNEFAGARHEREEADYHYKHDKDTAQNAVSFAQDFVKKMKELLTTQQQKN